MQPHSEAMGPIAMLDCARQRRFEVLHADGLAAGDSPAFATAIDGRRVIAVTTPTVDAHYGAALRAALRPAAAHRYFVLRADERRKQLPAVQGLCRLAADFKLDRRGAFVAFGGGVCSDVVTVAASMIRRGVDHIRVPTTLIGQIDAGIGVKGAVNLDGLKSFIGAFHPPAAVLIDPAFLGTLPQKRIRQGLSEIVKMALVRDAALFETIETHAEELLRRRFQSGAVAREAIAQSIRLMLEELQKNPFEDRGYERLVDFGHTFSPALEARSGFSISHGEAVAVDMALSAVIGAELGLCTQRVARRIVALLARIGLPVNSPLLDLDLCREAMASTSAHRGGRLNLVVPTQLGAADFVGAPALEGGVLERALARLPWFSPAVMLGPAAGAAAAMSRHFEAEHASPAV
jgi:2-epi-5-epi-valiolone synthase